MKLALLGSFCLVSTIASAQFQTPGSKFKFNNDFINRQNLSRPFRLQTSQPPATLIATNNIGKIYALPIDRMPCLVPDISQVTKMPNGVEYFNNSLMLNPYKKEEIIPQQ